MELRRRRGELAGLRWHNREDEAELCVCGGEREVKVRERGEEERDGVRERGGGREKEREKR